MKKDLKELINLPEKPGVYLMKDNIGTIIYIGKAKVLKNRVRQYFQSSKNHSIRIQSMISNISSFEYIVTDTEMEALILECNLIKKYKPYYNVLLKDDKNYPYIKITMNEDYPKILLSRKAKKDGARYFGPYTSSMTVRKNIDTIKTIFKVRGCNKKLPDQIGKERPCLNFHINKCVAPCSGNVSSSEYKDIFNNIICFLEGKHKDVLNRFEEEMINASNNMDFERAADYRDRIEKIKHLYEKQKIVSTTSNDIDIITVYFNEYGKNSCITMFCIRDGKLIGSKNFDIEINDKKDIEETISSFIKQYYNDAQYIPKEILIQEVIPEKDLVEIWLSDLRKSKVSIFTPQKGNKKKLLDLAYKNAKEYVDKITIEEEKNNMVLIRLKEILGIKNKIVRIESYDISNISGAESVGAMVVFNNGVPDKKEYRKFKIKTVEGSNDYDSLKEVLYRRFNRSKRSGDKSFSNLPNIIFVDGGKGHVNCAREVLDEKGINIPVFGLVKDKNHKTRGIISENIEIKLEYDMEVFKLISFIQDETHRFAIDYHRKLRQKKSTVSVLDDILGIGKKRKDNLFKEFKTINNIKNADIEALKNVESMDSKAARAVFDFFHKI